MKTIKKLSRGSGWKITEHEYDTINLICKFGHIYQDGKFLVAAANDKSVVRKLKRLGTVVADGDFGEVSVKFHPDRFRDDCRLLLPIQAR